MSVGRIVKALSGFYYVNSENEIYECRARGKFRIDGTSPLVGDFVNFTKLPNNKGTIDKVQPRKNFFVRPAVSNVDLMIILASAVNPITDPYLIDRVSATAEFYGCEVIILINKSDLNKGDDLYEIYSKTPYTVIRTSAVTGEGISELYEKTANKLCVFTGNSGVGKSSILNKICPQLNLKVAEVSDKLGRGKHTTRHVELFPLDNGGFIVDTPGFASFDVEKSDHIPKEKLQYCFGEFGPYLGSCRFMDCAHISEPGCSILEALEENNISKSRHESYKRLYEAAAKIKDWERKDK